MHIAMHKPSFAVWITGLPASGKSTLASALAQQIRKRGAPVTVLESDALRRVFSDRPTYDEQDRERFYTSMAFIGRILTEQNVSVIFDATASLRSYRDKARRQIPHFVEVFVDSPLETCIRRDPKGIYRQAREGQAAHVPGVGAVYEPPEHPDVVVHGDRDNPDDAACQIAAVLIRKGLLPAELS